MTQSFSQLYMHLIFSTKGRCPFLQDKAFRQRVHAYLAGTCNNLGCASQIVGGVEDHVHVLCRLSKKISVADLIRELKRESSKWVKQEMPSLGDFAWQTGYGAFSISPSHVAPGKVYIRNQEEHHKTESYQDEFRRICKIHGIEVDERYAWD